LPPGPTFEGFESQAAPLWHPGKRSMQLSRSDEACRKTLSSRENFRSICMILARQTSLRRYLTSAAIVSTKPKNSPDFKAPPPHPKSYRTSLYAPLTPHSYAPARSPSFSFLFLASLAKGTEYRLPPGAFCSRCGEEGSWLKDRCQPSCHPVPVC